MRPRMAAGLLFGLTLPLCAIAQTATPAQQSAGAGLEYLRRVMDQFHNRFPVYDDVSSAGNHFHAWSMIPDEKAAVTINGSWADNPRSGATAIRCEFRNATGESFGGVIFQNGVLPPRAGGPQPNFGTAPNAGVDLSGAVALTFWARGERGGEEIEFFMGGVGRDPDTGEAQTGAPYPDSTPAVKGVATLMKDWKQYRIDLSEKNLRYVLGGFGWVASAASNPKGAVFYLDDIQYELNPARRDRRLDEPRFLKSHTTAPVQPDPNDDNEDDDFDLVLRNTADTYDNALALLAFLAEGRADGLRRARRIGDAFVYASEHDRTFEQGRLRSKYAAGDISLPPGWTPNGRAGTVPAPGFYNEKKKQLFEVGQEAVDTGNNAWAMIALLALYQRTNDPPYLKTARRLGDFIRMFRQDTGRYRGFRGGLHYPRGEASQPERRHYASAEHNLDIFAAFTTMFEITGEPRWRDDAEHAGRFVEAMWDPAKGCYLTGTKEEDPDARNTTPGQLPLDVQAWSVLAVPDTLKRHPGLLARAEENHRTGKDGFSGFDFNEDKDGVWFEGTAQMAAAYALAGQPGPADGLRQELRRAQQTPAFGDGRGIVAASRDGLSTGFGFQYFRRLHVGATAWNVFAQLGVNPYYLPAAPPSLAAIVTAPADGAVTSPVTINVQTRPGDVYVGTKLSPGFDMGVNTSQEKTDWVIDHKGYMECRYPAGQQWGAVFITVGKPTSVVAERKTKDYSKYRFLVLEMKGAKGGEVVNVGVKTNTDPDDGREPKRLVSNLTTDWQTITIPLTEFVRDPAYPMSRLSRLYVVCEFVFELGVPSETIFFRNIRFEE